MNLYVYRVNFSSHEHERKELLAYTLACTFARSVGLHCLVSSTRITFAVCILRNRRKSGFSRRIVGVVTLAMDTSTGERVKIDNIGEFSPSFLQTFAFFLKSSRFIERKLQEYSRNESRDNSNFLATRWNAVKKDRFSSDAEKLVWITQA